MTDRLRPNDSSTGLVSAPDHSATSGTAAGDEKEVEPVEVLVGLAEDGEIDPWDIDIVQVTDAFLARLDETDLRTSGRALFYASVLLRMKSDAVLDDDQPEDSEPDSEPWERQFGGDPPEGHDAEFEFDPVDELEAEMERRLKRKSTRGSPETLDELVRELRDAERGSWWKDRREYDTSESPRGYRRGTQELEYRGADDPRREGEPGTGDVTSNTHEEDIETVIADVKTELRHHYDAGRPEVLFREVREAGGRAVMTYLALLFLANRGKVRLQQDDLFGDLWVQDPSVDAVGGEAIAD